MHKLPTDREIIKCIYEMYESAYYRAQESQDKGPYISIDLDAAADKLNCHPEILFGRLYYHLERKHGYKQDDGGYVPLFALQVGGKRHAIHFPYLAAILAGHQQEYRKQAWSVVISIIALTLSIASLLFNVLKH